MKKIPFVVSVCVIIISIFVSCRNDPAPAKPQIEKIIFSENAKEIFVGDVVQIPVTIEPKEARAGGKIEYTVTGPGIIEIKEESGLDGVVFEGLKSGSLVITAKANGVVDYCSVTVKGNDTDIIPHIIVPGYVLELRENERRSITATLAGGTPVDNSGFTWSYTNQKSIKLESTGNVGVIDTLSAGESVITISHPKAHYNIDVLVFVLGNNETPVYISTEHNIINLQKGAEDFEFQVLLKGGTNDDAHGFVYEVTDGKDIIDVTGNNNIGTISVKDKGIAKIQVSHIKALYTMEIIVIVHAEVEYRYIDVGQPLLIMQKGETENIYLGMVGDVPNDYTQNFSYEADSNESITIVHSNDNLYINAIQAGKTIISINNKYADFKKKILVVVNDDDLIIDKEIYINTDQNVVTMEAGGADTILSMMLVGGVEADRNNFIWTVDDSTVISVETADGRVEYEDLRYRSAVSNVGKKYETKALIKAKKVGTAKITLENPKSRNTCTVIVKVYKKGTFGVLPVVIGGIPYNKVETGGQRTILLSVSSGLKENAQDLLWEIQDTSIASVEGTGLTGVIRGIRSGITTLRVTGSNLKHEFTSVIMVGSEDYLEDGKFIYVLNPYMSVIQNESLTFKVMTENMTNEEISALSVVNNTPEIISVFAYRNSVNITGLNMGTGELIIRADDANTIKVSINVEEYDINPNKPYYLRSNIVIQGVVKGSQIELEVDLVGGNTVNQGGIIWLSDNSMVADVNGNGRLGIVTGNKVGQTAIKVNHLRSNNELVIVIYVVEDEAALQNQIVLYTQEDNILLRNGEEKYISLITNANDVQKNSINWNVGNSEIVEMNVSGSRTKALIRGNDTGITGATNIVITSNYTVMPVNIYISVVSNGLKTAYVNVPSIVETVAGDIITIKAAHEGLIYLQDITWSINEEDKNIASLSPNGDMCIVNALVKGNAKIMVGYKGTDFVKDILLVVYGSVQEMANSYSMGAEQSRYIINKGDVITVGLVFGMKGYPEHELANIRWQADESNTVKVTGNGKRATVEALTRGIGYIKAEGIANTIEIEVEVRETGNGSKYWFGISDSDRIKGLVINDFADITFRVYNSDNVLVENISGIKYTVENANVISIVNNGNAIRVTAKEAGQSYITLSHNDKLIEEARILIYAAENENALNNMYPLMVDTENYLLQKGESRNIVIETIDHDMQKINNISYALDKDNGTITINEKNKREIVVSAHEAGNDIVLVKYNNTVVQKIYVSVTAFNSDISNGYLFTEGIIGMIVNESHISKISTNINGTLSFNSDNTDIVRVDEINHVESEGVLTGVSEGKAYITIRKGNIERYMLVVVCANEQELESLKAINIEQRYHRIYKGDNLVINIISNTGIVEGTTVYSDNYSGSTEYGNVIKVNNEENNKIEVYGLNEGIAAIRVSNSIYGVNFVVYVEVNNKQEGFVDNPDNYSYLVSQKTLYVIDVNNTNVYMGVDMSNYVQGTWSWEGYDKTIIDVRYTGNYAIVNPIMEGETVITVAHSGCINTIKIIVIVGERFNIETNKDPYIYVEKDVFEIIQGTGNIIIDYKVMNVTDYVYDGVSIIQYNSDIAGITKHSDGKLNVQPYKEGIARFEIKYMNFIREIYIVVRNELVINHAYLTTSENFVITTINSIRTVNVSLMGYNEPNGNNFEWMVNNSGVVKVVGNGSTGQIFALGLGEAVITVQHNKASYPLSINVKVVRDSAMEKAVYLTTQANVIETVVGDNNNYIYVQKIGGNPQLTNCTWAVSNPSIVSIQGNGLSAMYTAKKAGTAKITVKTNESPYTLTIVMIIKDSSNSDMYITSNEHLIMLAPGDYKYIDVSLVNGDLKDNNRFIWSVYSYNATNPDIASAGGNVINILSSNNTCRIDALNEGTARIRVSHEKSDMPLYITVYVTMYNELDFSESQKEIVVNDSDFVHIKIPTYEYLTNKVKVYSDNPDVCDVIYTSSSVLLMGKKKGIATITAKIEEKNTEAQLHITVVDEIDFNINRIVVGSTLYNLTTRSDTVKINAAIVGLNAIDNDNDNIAWEVISGTEGVNAEDIIRLYPATKKGREVQITPAGKEGQVIIKVRHGSVEEKYSKNILVFVNSSNNSFALEKDKIKINGSEAQTLRANIVGGTSKDYDEIKWVANKQQKWDGTYVEVVRVIGSGREVLLYPMHDGIVNVYAVYGTESKVCEVTVVSDYYFDFTTGNLRLYPGQGKDIAFEVRPASSNITWTVSANNDVTGDPVIAFGEIVGSSLESGGSSRREAKITALREGNAMVIGMANGKVGYLNVYVKKDYRFSVYTETSDNKFRNQPGTPVEVGFTVYPPNTYIKLNGVENYPGLTYEIKYNIDPTTKDSGVGKVIFNSIQEINRASIEFVQCEYRQSADEKETATSCDSQFRTISFLYPNPVVPKPYFVRHSGEWSNSVNRGNKEEKADKSGKIEGSEKIKSSGSYANNNLEYEVTLGDGEEHYILFDKEYENAKMEFTGIVGSNTLLESAYPNNSSNSNSTDSSINKRYIYKKDDKKLFEVMLGEVTHNGVLRQAIILSGCDDYVEYTRAAFKEDLVFEVNGKKTEAEIFQNEYIYDNIYTFDTGEPEINNSPVSLWSKSLDINGVSIYLYKHDKYLMYDDKFGNIGADIPIYTEFVSTIAYTSNVNRSNKYKTIYAYTYDTLIKAGLLYRHSESNETDRYYFTPEGKEKFLSKLIKYQSNRLSTTTVAYTFNGKTFPVGTKYFIGNLDVSSNVQENEKEPAYMFRKYEMGGNGAASGYRDAKNKQVSNINYLFATTELLGDQKLLIGSSLNPYTSRYYVFEDDYKNTNTHQTYLIPRGRSKGSNYNNTFDFSNFVVDDEYDSRVVMGKIGYTAYSPIQYNENLNSLYLLYHNVDTSPYIKDAYGNVAEDNSIQGGLVPITNTRTYDKNDSFNIPIRRMEKSYVDNVFKWGNAVIKTIPLNTNRGGFNILQKDNEAYGPTYYYGSANNGFWAYSFYAMSVSNRYRWENIPAGVERIITPLDILDIYPFKYPDFENTHTNKLKYKGMKNVIDIYKKSTPMPTLEVRAKTDYERTYVTLKYETAAENKSFNIVIKYERRNTTFNNGEDAKDSYVNYMGPNRGNVESPGVIDKWDNLKEVVEAGRTYWIPK